MANAGDILAVRVNTNEAGTATYSDGVLSTLIDDKGSVEAASAEVWLQKAAVFSEMVDVSEAGASRKLGDLYKNAIAMARTFTDRVPDEILDGINSRRAKVHKIERT